MRFDLVDLRLVLNIAEAASITAGASRSGLALASASERLRDLERALGVELFERQRRGVSATPAGLALIHHACLVIRQLDAMSGELGQFAKGLRGRVRVMSNTAATLEFLPPLIGAFLSRHPTIDVEIDERPSSAIVRAVAGGQADFGIVADVVDAAAELETIPFAEDRLVLVLPKGHALTGRKRLAFQDVLDEDFVGLPAGSALQVYVDGQAAREGRRLKTRIRLSGFDAACKVVESGIGIAVVSKIAAARCARSMAIAMVPLSDAWALRRLRICARSFRALPPPARALVEALRPGSA
jgi:DNA-binding transcriptional LysR family regulator